MNRRGFLESCLALAVAPAIVRADSLMRIVPWETSILTEASLEELCVKMMGAVDYKGLSIALFPTTLLVLYLADEKMPTDRPLAAYHDWEIQSDALYPKRSR